MAKGETIGGLYIRLGLNYDELNQDFVAVEETISANIQRLNRESKLIRLKADIDLSGITDASERLKIQQQALTAQIEKQAQKVKLYETEWLAANKANGAASQQAQKAAIALKQQELALARLQQQLRAVTAEQQALAKSSSKGGGLLDGYNNIKGDISGAIGRLSNAFQGLKDASGSADGAITKTLEIIDAIPSPVGKAVAALASIPLVVKGVENSLLNLAQPAISAGDSFYAMARGLQMSMADAAKFNMICKVTGIEVSEVVNTTKRLQSQIVKAGENSNTLTKALQKYGVEARTASGELKDAFEMSLALAEGLKRAQALGESRQFIASLGRGISGDYVTYLEDLFDNIGLAASVVKNGLENPTLAHGIQGNINAMNAQSAQLGSAFSSAFMPVADVVVPQITERMSSLVKIIEDNANAIKDVGFAVADVVTAISEATTAIIKFGLESAKYLTNPNRVSINATLARYKDSADEIKSFNDFIEKELQRLSESERLLIESSPQQLTAFKNQRVEPYAKLKEMYERDADLQKKKADELAAELKRQEDTWKAPFTDEEFQSSLERVKKIQEELSRVNLDLQFGNSGAKVFAELDLWYKEALAKAEGFVQEQNTITELYAARREKIIQESSNRASDFVQQAADTEYHATHTNLENQLYDIKRWQDAQIEKATTAEEIAAIVENATAKENAAIQKNAQQSIERANNLIKETATLEFHATHNAFENQLYDIEQWKKAQLEKADTAEEVAATIADAAAKEADAFEREMDRIQGKIGNAQDRLARLTLSQKDYDLYKARKQYEQDLQDLPSVLADALFSAEINRIRRTSKGKHLDYNQTPRQFYDYSNSSGRAAIDDMYKNLNAKSDPLLKINPKNYAQYKAQQELETAKKAIAPIVDASVKVVEPFNQQIQSTTDSVTQFDTAIKEATNALRGGRDNPEPKPNQATTTGEKTRQNNYSELKNLLAPRQDGEIKITYLDALAQELNDLDSGTRDRLDRILSNLPAGINVENLKELLRDNSGGEPTIVYLDAAAEELDGLSDDIRAALVDAIENQLDNVGDEKLTGLAETFNATNTALEKFTETLGEATEKLSRLDAPEKPKTPETPETPKQDFPKFDLPEKQEKSRFPELDPDIMDKALKGTATLGEILAVGGVAAGNPAVALVGAGIQAIGNTAQTLHDMAKNDAKAPEKSSPETGGNLEEFGSKLRETGEASDALAESLKKTASAVETEREKLPQRDDFDMSFLVEALENFRTSLDAATQSAANFGSALEKISQQESQPEISPVNEQLESFRQALEKANQAAENFAENLATKNPENQPAQIDFQVQPENFQQALDAAGQAAASFTEQVMQAAERLAQLDIAAPEIQPVSEQLENLRQSLEESAQSITDFAESVRLTAEKISQLEPATLDNQAVNSQLESFSDAIETAGQSLAEFAEQVNLAAEKIATPELQPVALDNQKINAQLESAVESAGQNLKFFAEQASAAAEKISQLEIKQPADVQSVDTENFRGAIETAEQSALNFGEQINLAAEKIARLDFEQNNIQPVDTENFSLAVESAGQSALNFAERTKSAAEKIAQLEFNLPQETARELPQLDFSALTQPFTEQTEIFRQSLETAGQSVTAFAERINLAAEKIAYQAPENQATPESAALEELRTSFQTVVEKLQQLAEPSTDFQSIIDAQQQIVSEIQQLSETAGQYFSEIISAIQAASENLSQQIENSRQSGTNSAQSQPININSSPNINLGGAYVFDDAMKRQLTDDIATEVANRITNAVQSASRNSNYGYGN